MTTATPTSTSTVIIPSFIIITTFQASEFLFSIKFETFFDYLTSGIPILQYFSLQLLFQKLKIEIQSYRDNSAILKKSKSKMMKPDIVSEKDREKSMDKNNIKSKDKSNSNSKDKSSQKILDKDMKGKALALPSFNNKENAKSSSSVTMLKPVAISTLSWLEEIFRRYPSNHQ